MELALQIFLGVIAALAALIIGPVSIMFVCMVAGSIVFVIIVGLLYLIEWITEWINNKVRKPK